MTSRVQNAIDCMKDGNGCARSILCAFADDIGLTHDEAMEKGAVCAKNKGEKCGAVYAGEIVLQLTFHGEGSAGFIAEMERDFFDKFHSLKCAELRQMNDSNCLERVEFVAKWLDYLLEEY